ncbi:hypothetical protein BEN48_03820 [Hymenobacter glacialis]|uniref:Major facilitator superfamily (MFS) profile domain-containing protein n=1 Tax=Hymenobacter glacialis TaxID=1908236 RepID=A0A1G1SZ74_9BACT|nr:hypothetical protein BEN48_03820 [Hymenobacter glacialis]
MAAPASRPYSTGFWLMCLSSFLFFLSFNLLLPELPDHLARMGGDEYKGYIIALFTLTAAISRPYSGKLADTVGRIPVMVLGSLVCFVCGFFYPWAITVTGFLTLRLVHGFSTGFKPTSRSPSRLVNRRARWSITQSTPSAKPSGARRVVPA